VEPEPWRVIGRWLLVLPVFIAGLFAAVFVAQMFGVLLEQSCLQWAEHLKLNVQPSLILDLLYIILSFLILSIWTIPTAFAIGFALQTSKAIRVQWGLSAALLLTIGLVWATKGSEFLPALRAAMVSAVACLVCGLFVSFRLVHKARTHLLTNAITFAILTLPCFLAFAESPAQPPNASRIWSTVLENGGWQGVPPGTEFFATHHVAFSGDRVLAAVYGRLLSIEIKTGELKNSLALPGSWEVMPNLFATSDGHVIVEQGSIKSLNPDLTDAGPQLNIKHGRVMDISPDGSTLAWATEPETVLLDSHTLTPKGRRLAESKPDSVSASAVLTWETLWRKEYPKDSTFVGLTDEQGFRLIFHGNCGIPQFLNNEMVILAGCGKIRILNLAGDILKEVETGNGPARLANLSQDGRRIALEFSEEIGDSPILLYDYFLVFDAGTLQPLARVSCSETPARQPWSAFSADGRYFVAGNPNNLCLYQIP